MDSTAIVFVISILIWPLCFLIIGLILLQGGAGDLSSAFGGGGQLDSTLGVGAGRKMSKLTAWLGIAFLLMVTVLAIPRGLHVDEHKSATLGENAPPEVSPAPGDKPAAGVPTLSPSELKPIKEAGAPIPADGLQNPLVTDPTVAPPAPAVPAPGPTSETQVPPVGDAVNPAAGDAAKPADAPAPAAAPAKRLKLDD